MQRLAISFDASIGARRDGEHGGRGLASRAPLSERGVWAASGL